LPDEIFLDFVFSEPTYELEV